MVPERAYAEEVKAKEEAKEKDHEAEEQDHEEEKAEGDFDAFEHAVRVT